MYVYWDYYLAHMMGVYLVVRMVHSIVMCWDHGWQCTSTRIYMCTGIITWHI